MTDVPVETPTFAEMNLPEPVVQALNDVGYERPSPIQAESIPHLLNGEDVLGVAQTGTGKTAAFALPILAQIDIRANYPQALILAPTRELAIQVSEAFQSYSSHIKGFHVAPIYGGQDMRGQIRQLKRGVHVVVGTPGRVMDHLRRGTLKLDDLKTVVLDEADEMLRMGFIEDIEWIMEHTPESKQSVLFSATMPPPIRKIATNYLNQPKEVRIQAVSQTVDRIDQSYILVNPRAKLDALTRVLETEDFDGIMMFVRTKVMTEELSSKLEARGYASAAIHGDLSQALRIKTIDKFKDGKIDILIATDVAARGIDVPRVSHVVNYDIPYDPEAYVHRIGRTGRAGRSGKAVLLIAPRERRLLHTIEKVTKTKIARAQIPTHKDLTDQRITEFNQAVTSMLEHKKLETFRELAISLCNETGEPLENIAAAFALMAQQKKPLFVPKDNLLDEPIKERERGEKGDRKNRRERSPRGERADVPMETYRLEVGRNQKVSPGDVVGAIANEADIESKYIGSIKLFDEFTLVDLPTGMPEEILQQLKKTRVRGKAIDIKKDRKPSGSGFKKSRRRDFSGDKRKGKAKREN